VTVAVPTLAADDALYQCARALERQCFSQFEMVVVDNSGRDLVREAELPPGSRVIRNRSNAGFGAAINAAFRTSAAPYLAALNDDALPHPGWLGALVAAMERRPDVGMCASQVRLEGQERLDSTGMLVCGDGSSKQRGHLRPAEDFPVEEEVLFPSGSAALYRRAMLDQVGLFDEDFFLYCEDTDLGLRARWQGWRCLYVPEAVVEHRYSHSAGSASPLKAYYVERNRLFVLLKNFPGGMLWKAPIISLVRYFWHAWAMLAGRGAAGRYRQEGNGGGLGLAGYILKAHAAFLGRLVRLWRQRLEIRRAARISPAVYRRLLAAHSIRARRVAEL